jgi:hypothetical protein
MPSPPRAAVSLEPSSTSEEAVPSPEPEDSADAELYADADALSGSRPEAVAILVSVVGLLIQAVGYAYGWHGHESPAIGLWYLGFVLVVSPYAWLLLLPARTGHQRLAASVAVGVLMYASWLLSDPIMATRFDETLHVTSLVTLLDEHRFFEVNPTLPVSPRFPGIELATAGVHWLTGLPLFACQVVVVLTARVTLVLSLFLIISRLGRSTRVGAAGVLLYAASAQFYFFNSQFSYQTVAIAMLVAALYLLVRAIDSEEERPWRELLAAQVCLAALAVTHHLTSLLAVTLLWVLVLFFWREGDRGSRRFKLTLVTAEIATVLVAAWIAVIAPLLISYFSSIVDGATSQLLALLDGGSSRSVGASTDGSAAPTWELMVMAGSVLLWTVMVVPAAWAAWRGKTVGLSRARYVPLLIALAYPCLQLARVSSAASEISDRASTFVTMGLAVVVGAWLAPRLHVYQRLVVPGFLVLVLGGALLGSGPDWARVPGPYLAGAEQRSVDAETVSVAQWAGTYLPADSRIAADATFSRLLPNYAPVDPIVVPSGEASIAPVFIATTIDQQVLRVILRNDVDFIFVDTRLVGQTVRSGGFYIGGNGYGADALTVSPEQVTKFEDQRDFDLVLDGPVRVYDVRPLRDAPQTFVERDPPVVPGSWTPWQAGGAALLLVIGLAFRGRLLDPRRFQAHDVWRVAVLLPAAMVLGAVGVPLGFPPWAGLVAAALIGYGLIRLTGPPRALPARAGGLWPWSVVIGLVAVASIAVAVWSAWHGLLGGADLPAPAVGSGA